MSSRLEACPIIGRALELVDDAELRLEHNEVVISG